MTWGFEIICKHLGVSPSPNVTFFLFTVTRHTSGGLTPSWLSFRAHTNQKVFLLYEESFHHFKPFYLKVFGAPGITLFWEMLEGKLRFNCYWSKHFDAHWIDEGTLKLEEQVVIQFLLQSFGKNYLNMKNIVGVEVEVARRYLGLCFSFIVYLPLSCFHC